MGHEAKIRKMRKTINSAMEGMTPTALLTEANVLRTLKRPAGVRPRTAKRAALRAVTGTPSIMWLTDRHLDAHAALAARTNERREPKDRVEPIKSTTDLDAIEWWARVLRKHPEAFNVAKAHGNLTPGMLKVNPLRSAV